MVNAGDDKAWLAATDHDVLVGKNANGEGWIRLLCGVVVVAENTGSESLIDRVREFRKSSPTDGLIIATECHSAVAIQLRNIAVDEIVWLHRLESDLLPAIARAADHVDLGCLTSTHE